MAAQIQSVYAVRPYLRDDTAYTPAINCAPHSGAFTLFAARGGPNAHVFAPMIALEYIG